MEVIAERLQRAAANTLYFLPHIVRLQKRNPHPTVKDELDKAYNAVNEAVKQFEEAASHLRLAAIQRLRLKESGQSEVFGDVPGEHE